MALPNVPVVQDRSTALQFGRQFARGLNATEFTAVPNAGQALLYVLDLTEEDVNAQFKPITASGLVTSAGAGVTRAAKAYVDEKITALIDGAPDFLDTLKELADAINDDPDYFLTIRSRIAGVSGVLQSQQIATSGFLLNAIVAVSGALEQQIQHSSGHVSDNLAAVSGALNSQINTDIASQQGRLQTVSGVITTLISNNAVADQVQREAISGALITGILANKADIAQEALNIVGVAAGAQTQIQSTSGVLNSRIDSIDAVNDQDLHNVSGVLNTLIQTNATDITARAALAGAIFSGNVEILKQFPDFQLKSGDEKRILFTDAGGAGTAAIKNVSSTMDFFANGIAAGNKELVVEGGAVDVINSLKIGGVAVTADAAEINQLDGTTITAFAKTLLDDADAGATKTTLSLQNVDNTSDANKPVSTAQQTALDLKATIANPEFTGALSRLLGANTSPTVNRTEGGFPDFALRTNSPDIAVGGNEGRLLWEDQGGGATAAIKSIMLTSEPMKFFTGGITASDERMRINANGRVGIGSTNPQALLHVEGSTVLKADFPDLQFYSGGERRVLFSDAGGSAEGGIKFSSNTMKFFAGGIAAGNQIFSIDADSVDVDQTLVCTDGLNTNDINVDSGKITYNTGSNILASVAGFATAGTVTTGSISTTGAGSIDAADLALPNIAEYADDAAAATGGLAVGHVYRTGSVLKIRVS